MYRRHLLTTGTAGSLTVLAGCLDGFPNPFRDSNPETNISGTPEYGLALVGIGHFDQRFTTRLEAVEGTWGISTETGLEQWHLDDYLLVGEPVATTERLVLPCEAEDSTDSETALGSNPGYLVSVDPNDGQPQWKFQDEDSGFRGVAMDEDAVVAWTANKTLHCVDVDDGELRWTIDEETYDGFNQLFPRNNNLVVRDGTVLINAIESLVALDLDDASLNWRFDDVTDQLSDIASGQDAIYLADRAGLLHAINPGTGDLLWQLDPTSSNDQPVGSFESVEYGAGLLIVSELHEGTRELWGITATGPSAGQDEWYREFDGSIHAVTISSDQIFVGVNPTAAEVDQIDLIAVDAATGSELWHHPINGGAIPSLVVKDDELIVPWGEAPDNPLQILERSTGDEIQSFPELGHRVLDLLVDPGRELAITYVSNDDGTEINGIDLADNQHTWTFAEYDGTPYFGVQGV